MALAVSSVTRILFFGDSITEFGERPGGYISLLRQKVNPNEYQLIGSGIGGNKVYDLYFRLEADVLSRQPHVAVVFEGVNDVWHKSSVGTGTDLIKYERFYQALVQKLKASGIRLVLITPACIGEKPGYANAQDEDLNRYCDVIRSIVVAEGCTLLDFRKEVVDYLAIHNTASHAAGIITTDGVHLNDTGNRLLADALWKTLGF